MSWGEVKVHWFDGSGGVALIVSFNGCLDEVLKATNV